jgi:hypothetical protein
MVIYCCDSLSVLGAVTAIVEFYGRIDRLHFIRNIAKLSVCGFVPSVTFSRLSCDLELFAQRQSMAAGLTQLVP